MPLHIIILAAGQGKRMCSSVPKVLQPLGGLPMLSHVIEVARALNPTEIHVVYGHGGEQIRQTLGSLPVHWVLQEHQLGTGHAVMQALPFIAVESQVLILSADVPLIRDETLMGLLSLCIVPVTERMPLGLIVTMLDNPTGLGRIVRDERGRIVAIVEEKDADDETRDIHEIYSGICCVMASDLVRWLPQLSSSNAQGEYYLTEIVAMAVAEGLLIAAYTTRDATEINGVNNFLQLQQQERIWQNRQAECLMLSGVRLADASRIDIRGELTCGKDVFIDVNVVFEGRVIIGDGCHIEPNCYLTHVTMGADCVIHANSVLDHCQLGNACQIGPFARLRPGTILADRCKIGNFVEIKNSLLGEDSKANHLSYLGDAVIGENVNIGAGTITCNYDGANKYQTTIEDGVFIGSDTQLIAPVTVGKNATIGAGSTIRRNVPPEELTLSESKQKTIMGWKRPVKKSIPE